MSANHSVTDGPAISVKGVARSFGKKAVLRGVTASAARGRVVGLLGRNGEGKTTLFHILLDILAADSGEVSLLGIRPDGTGAVRREVGYVPERPVFHEFLDIGEVLRFRSTLFPRWDAGKAADLARRLGLDLATRIRGASKGTLGKLAWVCAAAHDPALFLLDEPTSGLDALVREDVLGQMIGELHDTGKTILVANHRMEELAGVLDEVWVLRDGVIAGVHEVDALRSEACRVSGRLRDGQSLPEDVPLLDARVEGALVHCALLAKSAFERLAASGVLEGVDRSPLPLEESMKLLLRDPQGGLR